MLPKKLRNESSDTEFEFFKSFFFSLKNEINLDIKKNFFPIWKKIYHVV